jgi:transcriptional antiterminator RfaH
MDEQQIQPGTIQELKPGAAAPPMPHDSGAVDEFAETGPRWHVLHCRSRQEKRVVEALEAQGVPSYLPLVAMDRRYGHRRRRVEFPLFSGYVFMNGLRSDAFALVSGKRVVRVIPVIDQRVFAAEVEQIREALHRGAYLDPCPALVEGWRVRVAKGPFEGIEGMVEAKPRPDRLVLQIGVLGQGATLDISAFEVEVIGPPATSLRGGR